MSTTGSGWSILSSHGLVLLQIAVEPQTTHRELSDRLGITERHVARVVRDLERAGLLNVKTQGRRNHYEINAEARLRHPVLSQTSLGELVDAIRPLLVTQMETVAGTGA